MNTENKITDLATYLGILDLPDEVRDGYINQFTTIILDGSIEELLQKLSPEEALMLTNYLEIAPTLEQLISHLINEYPKFQSILETHVQRHNLIV